jgi:predicted nucleotidyltransferase
VIGSNLSSVEVETTVAVFARHPGVSRVILFGSRAKGSARNPSDVDLAVAGTRDDREVEALAVELDELPLPYRFDLKSIERIRNRSLLDHIERVGKAIYVRGSSARRTLGPR